MRLMANVRRRGLSYFPVIGAGQEEKDGEIRMNKEVSLVVQPVGKMADAEFLDHIRQLLFNPTGEPGPGPFAHTQWGAAVKLPEHARGVPDSTSGRPAHGPADYKIGEPLGGAARARRASRPTRR